MAFGFSRVFAAKSSRRYDSRGANKFSCRPSLRRGRGGVVNHTRMYGGGAGSG